uniref:DNA polymerase eta n=1 Tax=Callorhinchus milii TaxID=7868 RepID=A0A4W3JNZ0_CALMI
MEHGKERLIALVDMDCFYVQVEQRLNPELRGKPCAVVQYNNWQGGGIIAVSYEARARGVTRNMRGDEAKKHCPELLLARIPESRGKADLTRYREASAEVISVMSRFGTMERASIDEAYLELTGAAQERLRARGGRPLDPGELSTTFVQGFPQPAGEQTATEMERQRGLRQWLDSLVELHGDSAELLLTMAAVIVEEMRAAVEAETGFQCSAGISHNKVLAKLSCGLNKPNRQTLLPLGLVPQLFDTLPISKVRNLGGKLGASIVERLHIEYMGQLRLFTLTQLQHHFGDKTGSWLYELCRGVEFEPLRPRQLPKSIGCSKIFSGRTALATCEEIRFWLLQLASELEERLTKDRDSNGRVAQQLLVGVRLKDGHGLSRCCSLPLCEATKIANDAFALIRNCNRAAGPQAAWCPAVTSLCLSASKFSEPPTALASGITSFLSSDPAPSHKPLPVSPVARREASKSGSSHKPVGTILSFFQAAADSKCKSLETTATSLPSCSDDIEVVDREPDTSCADVLTTCLRSEERDYALGQDFRGFSPSLRPSSTQEPSSSECLATAAESVGNVSNVERNLQIDAGLLGSTLPGACAWELVPGKGVTEPPILAPEDVARCEKCGEYLPVWDMPEHHDFHFAQNLQSSFSTPVPGPLCSPRARAGARARAGCAARGKSKRKQTPASPAKRSRHQRERTLDLYFQKSPPS